MPRYRTKDFYEAAILKAANYPLIELDRSQTKFSVFVFEDNSSKAQETITKYWSGEILNIPQRELISAIKQLKARLYSGH